MKVTLDTNVLVWLATQDDPAPAALTLQALKKAALIAVPTPVWCELVWVLLRGYRYTPPQAAHALRLLLQVRQVVCQVPAVLAGLAMLGACRAWGRACAGASFGASLGAGEAWDCPPQRAATTDGTENRPGPSG